MLELYLLLIFMIIGSIVALEAEDLLSSVVALGAVGLALCVTFLILTAPEVAITQLVVEILVLIILIRATLKRDLPFSTSGRWFINTGITICFILLFLAVAPRYLGDLPAFGQPLMRISELYLRQGVLGAGAANIVSTIVLDYRALDTLAEATVLFTAVVAVLAIVRRRGRKKENEQVDKNDE